MIAREDALYIISTQNHSSSINKVLSCYGMPNYVFEHLGLKGHPGKTMFTSEPRRRVIVSGEKIRNERPDESAIAAEAFMAAEYQGESVEII